MTLKEKFKERLYNQSHDDSECLRIKFENIDKVIDSQEKIADEFAIEFAEWILDWPEDWHRIGELLEIYKKEKELWTKK
jgi:plasmid maintenance system antidote protein VapI